LTGSHCFSLEFAGGDIMLDQELVENIRCLLSEEKCSYRAIARRLGVSRGAVKNIALGKRRTLAAPEDTRSGEFQPPRGMPRRCPGCGGKVQMPCLACYLRERAERLQSDRP
jgi:hypothetical protein